MSDFFEGLAARGSGAATALRPRVASAYETREAAELFEAETAAAPPVATGAESAAPVQAATADPTGRIVVRDVVLTPSEIGEPKAILPDRRFEQRLERIRELTRHEETIENAGEPSAAERQQERWPDTDLRSGALREPFEHRPEALPPRRPQPPLPHPAARVPRQPLTIRQAPPAIRQPELDGQSQSDPVVRITIGRVEVRAMQPAQPAPRPTPPPVAQGPTLAEFLEQRERRK